MHLLKQVFTLLILSIFLVSNFGTTFASNSERNNYIFKVVSNKSHLKKIKNGQKYINSIDRIVKKYENNEKALSKLNEKLEEASEKLSSQNSKKAQDLKKIIRYLDAKVDFASYELINKVLTAEDILKESNISESEQKEIEDKLVTLQLNLLEKGTSKIQDLAEDFEKYMSVEEKGTLKMNLDIDHESIGNIKSYFNFNNYTASSSNFDSQIKGHIDAMVDASLKGEDDFKVELKGFLNFISKDGNMYMLLEEFSILSHNKTRELEEIIEQIEAFAKENKYIKFSDEESKEALKLIKSITPQKILTDGKNILSKPMFQPYKKEGDKYYLIPTKYGCDKMKEFANKFDPWNGKTCSNSQYQDIIEELAEVGKIYIELGNVTKLGFESKFNSYESFSTYIKFTDTSINEVFAKFEDNGSYGGEFSLHYIKNEKLNILGFEKRNEERKNDFKFISTLDKNNRFNSIDSSANLNSSREIFDMKVTLQNNIIDGYFNSEIKRYSYDYNSKTGSYIPSKKYTGKISGKTKSDNTLDEFIFTYTGTDIQKNKQELTGKFTYDTPSFSFLNNYSGSYFKSDFEFGGTWNKYDKNFSAFDYIFNMSDTYGNNSFESNLSLDKKILTGGVKFIDNGEEYFSLITTGEYEKNHLMMNNEFKMVNPFIRLGGYSENNNTEYLNGSFNIGSDTRNNTNNANIHLDVSAGENEIINFNIDNKSKRIYKKVNINTPNNYIEYETPKKNKVEMEVIEEEYIGSEKKEF